MAPASEAEVQRTFVGAAGMDSSITVDMVAGVLQVIPLSALCMFSRAGHVHPHDGLCGPIAADAPASQKEVRRLCAP